MRLRPSPDGSGRNFRTPLKWLISRSHVENCYFFVDVHKMGKIMKTAVVALQIITVEKNQNPSFPRILVLYREK